MRRQTSAICACLTLLLCLAGVVNAQPVRIEVDVGKQHQTMRGFGASGAWWPTWMKDYPQEVQAEALDLLYDRDKGIGLSIFRYNLPVGGGDEITMPARSTNGVEVAPGEFDLSRDAAALSFLEAARDRGAERFVFFACSPPPRMTSNGMTSGGPDGGPNLKPSARADFAAYLLDLSTVIRDTHDLEHVAISPLNEPQWHWGESSRTQEGCFYEPGEAALLVRDVVRLNVARRAGFEIEAPESGDWASAKPYIDAMFKHAVVREHVAEVAVHSYWTQPEQRGTAVREMRASYPDLAFAMSEYCQMQNGHDRSIESGIEMAKVIHADLTVAGAVSWTWWLGIAAGNYKDGLIYAAPGGSEIETTKRLWVLGQWSRFIRPGHVRVAATEATDPLLVTAFKSPDDEELAVVIINPAAAAIEADLSTPGFVPASAKMFVTSDGLDLAEVETDGSVFRLPPASVATVLLNGNPADVD